jgi:putative ABC transport system permease protein
MRSDHPDADGLMGTVIALPMREALNFAWDILRIAAAAMAGAVGILLLIACANIAGLSLARSESRRREVAVRAALGASRFRIIRQSMIEMLLLALIGGLIAAAGAHATLRALGNVIPEDLFRVGEFRLDIGALVFSATVIVTAALVAGIAPALMASRTGGGAALREEGRSLGGVRASRLRRALVVGEVALGLVLTIAAGLMARSLSQASRVPLGFEAGGVMTAEVTLPVSDYANRDAVNRFFDATLERLRATQGVIAAGTHATIPLNNETFAYRVAVEGLSLAEEELPRAEAFRVSDGYFEAMQIAVIEGRAFSARDSRTGEMLAVVNRTFAREVLGGDAPGRRIHLDDDARTPATVIGVVDDVRHSDLATASPPQVYTWLPQRPYRRQFIVLRSTRPEAAAAVLRESIAAVDPNLPVTIRPMQDFVNEALLRWSVMATALAVFGAIGLGLGAIGLYGLIAYSVERRRREIGVRLALGASPRNVARSVILDGVRLAGIGIVIGLLGALAAGRLLSAALYGVPATDPLTLGGASAVYLAVAFAASALPAWRATRADPLTALRAD